MIFYSGSCLIVWDVLISDIFEMFYIFNVYYNLIQGTIVEQLCLRMVLPV